jgi:hypothetical protein
VGYLIPGQFPTGGFSVGPAVKRSIRGIPHLAKNERDAPNFLHAALDKVASAPFFAEGRINFAVPTKLHRKSGMWGTQGLLRGKAENAAQGH